MQNIHVKRYTNPESVGYQGWIEPEDESWILFIDTTGKPSLWIETGSEGQEGKIEHRYMSVLELPAQ